MITRFQLNGAPVDAVHEPGETALDYLRKQGFTSVKFAAEDGETGSDTILVDGRAMNSGLILMATLGGRSVTTLEGLLRDEPFRTLQAAFVDSGAIQCGYCTPGMLLAIRGLLNETPDPGEHEIREALSAVYCRCTGYVKPVQAVVSYLATKNAKKHEDD
ncbi:MAG: (2Fe-2S)-binding protein [FCB group bacterium]|nr:(2Fe-2S)-binding protein [FCB group bacterium]